MIRASATLTVRNPLGLHARAAAKLVRLASDYTSQISLSRDGQTVDAKSIMGVLLLCCAQGAEVAVDAAGSDARVAVDAIADLFSRGFGELD